MEPLTDQPFAQLPAASDPIPAVIETSDLKKFYRTGFWLTRKINSLQSCSLQVFQGENFWASGPQRRRQNHPAENPIGHCATLGRARLADG